MKAPTLQSVQDARASGRPVVLATRLPDGEQVVLPNPDYPELNTYARVALMAEKSDTHEVAGTTWFLHAFNPPARIVIVGAVHIAQALVPLASQLGYGVTVVDPRRSFATDDRFPNVAVSTGWPDEALDELRPDSRTAVVTLTHDPKLDDPALDRALKSEAFYIGALGSRKTHGKRLERLRALGHGDDALARIRGPVGFNIGAVTAPEIALSVLAQIVAVRRGSPLA